MGNLDHIWKHELEWIDYVQKQHNASQPDWVQEMGNQMVEKSLDYLKHEVFFEDLSWTHENGVFRCSSQHNEDERLGYLNAILKQFPNRRL
ncbi:hypothetical protein AGMMS49940_21360 [Spirochaetia bacterium]|nr:hypothetical protein AGMMS49940_21360 [Spirochaetia bacterium]